MPQRGWLLMTSSGYFLRPLGAERLLVALALGDPVGHRGPLLVVGEVLGQAGGVELQLAGGRGERVASRVLVELDQAGGDLLPVRDRCGMT